MSDGVGVPQQNRPQLCIGVSCLRRGTDAPAEGARAATGVVLPSKRPASLQQSVVARFSAPREPVKDAAE